MGWKRSITEQEHEDLLESEVTMAEGGSSLECQMLTRLVGLLVIAGLLAGQEATIPLATFSGTVHGVSSKLITIENSDGNLVDFEVNRKTRVMRGKKQISISGLATGDSVTIEARQERARFALILIAVTITAQ